MSRYCPCASTILAATDDPTFSFEFFPPKTDKGAENLTSALSDLEALEPSFVSLTYGAGGSNRETAIDWVERLSRDHGFEAMAHLTCVNATTDELRTVIGRCARPVWRTCWPCAATRRTARSDGPRPRAAWSTHAS